MIPPEENKLGGVMCVAAPRRAQEDTPPKAEVVGFGTVEPAELVVVDHFPEVNTGAIWKQVGEYISGDAAIAVILLQQWGVQTGLIGTTLGDDARGRRTVRQLKELGVLGEIRTSPEVTTPYELGISDADGNRTYFWRREPSVLATLDSADLSLIEGARLLYVDWYDGHHILRAMDEAVRLGVPVFLNFEHGHQDPALVEVYAPYVSICQAVTDLAQREDNAEEVARRLLDRGICVALVTMAGSGCLAATRQERVWIQAPQVKVVDACTAGATFSAGFMYGHLRGWSLEDKVRFGVAAASLKCTVVGLRAFPQDQVQRLARQLRGQCSRSPA